MDSRYPILSWRAAFDIATSWLVIAVSCYLVLSVSWWFYPIACFLVANRLLALALLCHEGLHRTLHANNGINDFLGRYFCAFPTLISFSKYRRVHLLHHHAVGSDRWDPDRFLYDLYPQVGRQFIAILAYRVLTLRNFLDFHLYYTEFPEALKKTRSFDGNLFVLSSKSDFLPFVIFQVGVVLAISYFGIWTEFLLLYVAPMILITMPYAMLMGGLQHGPIPPQETENVSRTIVGSKFYMWALLPLDINFHAEHHRDPSVPHYWLRRKSEDLKLEGVKLWSESYRSSLNALFKRQ